MQSERIDLYVSPLRAQICMPTQRACFPGGGWHIGIYRLRKGRCRMGDVPPRHDRRLQLAAAGALQSRNARRDGGGGGYRAAASG